MPPYNSYSAKCSMVVHVFTKSITISQIMPITVIQTLAVSTRPPTEIYLSRFALELSRRNASGFSLAITRWQQLLRPAAANAASHVVHGYLPGGTGMNSIIAHAYINDLDLD